MPGFDDIDGPAGFAAEADDFDARDRGAEWARPIDDDGSDVEPLPEERFHPADAVEAEIVEDTAPQLTDAEVDAELPDLPVEYHYDTDAQGNYVIDDDGNPIVLDADGWERWTGEVIALHDVMWQFTPPSSGQSFFFSASASRSLGPRKKMEIMMAFLDGVLSDKSFHEMSTRVMSRRWPDFGIDEAFQVVTAIIERGNELLDQQQALEVRNRRERRAQAAALARARKNRRREQGALPAGAPPVD